MGKEKKHKRHKSDRRERHEAVSGSSSSLRLVLKLGSNATPERDSSPEEPEPEPPATEPEPTEPPPPSMVAPLRFNMVTISEAETYRKEKKHKKKKKKDRERDRHRHRKERRHSDAPPEEEAAEVCRLSSSPEQEAAAGALPVLPAGDEEQTMEHVSAFLRASAPPPQLPASPPTAYRDALRRQFGGGGDSPEPEVAPPPGHVAGSAGVPLTLQTATLSPSIVLDRLAAAAHYQESESWPSPEPARKPPLQQFLEYLLRGLEKKDTHGFFRWPVTDALAPGYSSVIAHPMDFSTMRANVEHGRYDDLAAFQSDFRLMCSNAMNYNRPDTVYFKAARRLLHIGSKMMTPEKLVSLNAVLPAMWELSARVLGFDMGPPPGSAAAAAVAAVEVAPRSPPAAAPVDEEAEAAAVLQQVEAAARRARERLAARRPRTVLSYLRAEPDGSTCAVTLTPSGDGRLAGGRQMQVAPSVLAGEASQAGAGAPAAGKDEKKTPRPVRPAPAAGLEEAFHSTSQEEVELLDETYGDELGQQYAQSLRDFTADSPAAGSYADSLLDALTAGRHGAARARLDWFRQLAAEERAVSCALAAAVVSAQPPPAAAATAAAPAAAAAGGVGGHGHYAALRSLATLGVDVSFLDALESEERRGQEATPERGGIHPTHYSASQHLTGGGWSSRPSTSSAVSPEDASSHDEVDVEAVSSGATPDVLADGESATPAPSAPTSATTAATAAPTPPTAAPTAPQPGLHQLLADV